MKLFVFLVFGLLGASGLAFLLLGQEAPPLLVDASGRALTAGPAPIPARPATPAAPLDPFDEVRALIAAFELDEAEARLSALLESSDRDGETCTLLSEVARGLQRFDEAVEYGRTAVELLPDSPAAHLAHARALGAQTMSELDSIMGLLKAKPRIDRFLAAVERVIALDPEDVDARKLLVMYHMAPPPIGDPARAFEICAEIEQRDPISGRYWRALVHGRQEETERAIEVCREGIRDFPDEPSFRVALGGILSREGRTDEADEEYRLALAGAADEESPAPEVHLARYERAKLRIEGDEELEFAIELLTDYVAAAPRGDFLPSVAHALWRRGMALEKLGRRAEALADYRESVRRDADFSSAAEALAQLEASE